MNITFKEHEANLQLHWNDESIQIILNSRAVCSYISKDNCNFVLLCIPTYNIMSTTQAQTILCGVSIVPVM